MVGIAVVRQECVKDTTLSSIVETEMRGEFLSGFQDAFSDAIDCAEIVWLC